MAGYDQEAPCISGEHILRALLLKARAHRPITQLTLPNLRTVTLVFVGLIITASTTATTVPPLQQLYVLKEIQPNVERVGIIWGKAAHDRSDLMEQIQRASAVTSVAVVIAPVDGVSDIASAYRDLVRQNSVQAIWVVDASDDVVNSRMGRDFLVKNAAGSGITLLAPDEAWVEAGAHLAVFQDGSSVRLKVNKRSADAASLTIPDQYLERTDYLAVN